jgi:hypothetical protein
MCACVCAVVLLVLWVRCCMPLYKLIALRVHPRMMFCLLYIIIIFVSYYRLYHLCSVWWKVDGVKALLYHGPLSYIQCVHINYTGFCWFNVITSAGSTSATRGQCGLNDGDFKQPQLLNTLLGVLIGSLCRPISSTASNGDVRSDIFDRSRLVFRKLRLIVS